MIMVSAAPVFGVKLIELAQRVFTWFGHSLTVDAENWMAHPGSASAILNIVCHRRTPTHFVILSGDVHYSFVYDIGVWHYKGVPEIWQITCSGFKNDFPPRLLRLFDRLNRWLFASRSPLNWLTRRRAFRIRQRRPGPHSGRYRHQRLANGIGVGRVRVRIDLSGVPVDIEVLLVNGESVSFTKGYKTDWVHSSLAKEAPQRPLGDSSTESGGVLQNAPGCRLRGPELFVRLLRDLHTLRW